MTWMSEWKLQAVFLNWVAKMFLTPHKEGEFTAVDVFLFHDTKNVYSLETNDVESRSDFDDALQDM